ncbi:MAG: hypothetical protein GW808_03965 [Sphingomonadales bacterium]|nr:hypothetical protein [Sphingomonadales bacterium]PIX66313.1 MAG: hypothetical protein COZ43_07255 [Sphingomonadales bacterium CG_4_10_14_3_um_filter_58_15]NCO49233.1 hypothetical protein [Sphingomonadales bacterium]NCP00143.1 hypothetical protein [Sphingomonadales bacterium]NCP25777.1 hypothetical protein [Sphingomonadales bacterium]
MNFRYLLVPAVLLLASCSETPVEEKGDAAIAEHEIEIEQDALSLEQAADEAVKVLEEDIDAELAADGIGDPADQPAEKETEN